MTRPPLFPADPPGMPDVDDAPPPPDGLYDDAPVVARKDPREFDRPATDGRSRPQARRRDGETRVVIPKTGDLVGPDETLPPMREIDGWAAGAPIDGWATTGRIDHGAGGDDPQRDDHAGAGSIRASGGIRHREARSGAPGAMPATSGARSVAPAPGRDLAEKTAAGPPSRDLAMPGALTDEDVLIGSVLDEPRLFKDVSYVKPSDFESAFHQLAWGAIGATLRANGVVTPGSIHAASPDLDHGRLTAIARAAPRSPEACRNAARRVSDLRRAAIASGLLAEAAREIRLAASQPLVDVGDGTAAPPADWRATLSQAMRATYALAASSHVVNAAHVETRVRNRDRTSRPPLPTGISHVDRYLRGGPRGGQMIAIAAQTKVGKTVFGATISYNLEEIGVNHLFVTLERSEADIEDLKLARRLGVKGYDLDQVPQDAIDRLPLKPRCCEYLHRPGASIDEIRAEILYQSIMNGSKLVILDYWQLIASRNPRENPDQHLTRVSQIIQQTASEANVAFLVLVQVSDLGIPTVSTSIKNAANAFLMVMRDRQSPMAYFETMATNIGEECDIGRITSPAMVLDPAGPHFRDPRDGER